MYAVIFANGVFNHSERVDHTIRSANLLIAADGGLRLCARLGLTPDVLIGDFDSLGALDLESLRQAGVLVVDHPVRKDATDLELAVHYAVDHGATEISILGGVGSRWDQSLANLLLATTDALSGVTVRLVDGSQEAQLLRGGDTLTLLGEPGDTVSLLPLADDAVGVTTTGLEYPLENGNLRLGSTRGVSNTLVSRLGTVSLDHGTLLCTIIHGPVDGLKNP